MTLATIPKSSLGSTFSKTSDLETFEKKYSPKEVEPNHLNTSSEYFTKIRGAYRLFQFIKKFCAWPILYAKNLKLSAKTVTKFVATRSKFKTAESLLLVPKMIFDVKEINKSYKEGKAETAKNKTRSWTRGAKEIVEIVVDCSAFLQLGEMLGIYALGSIIGPAASFTGSLFMLFQHVFCLKMEREDFISLKALHVKEGVNIKGSKRLTAIFSENINLDLIKLTKSIISVALSFFLIAEFVFSMTLLAPQILLFLSTAATVLAIWSHFYKESMTYPFKEK